ncbi:rifin [Plasmodium falciparum IGH-CR14]|uniref:Rifin n=1 Tax=Plasmodium falciparum IGH-CR14 TaxID=580059 RepID=A0A0L1IBT0_PLAFA|nr:rifin [Plasmodium falciparum IGH-CR14]
MGVWEHNKNKPSITPNHTRNTTSRLLSEYDLYIPNYDKDQDMKSVKENFDRQTSKRFEEYDERMKDKRKKCKEQRDKDIQKIILKDKMEKSLEEKVEKVCLRCGCGLGGVVAGVGIFGALGIYGWERAAIEIAKEIGMNKATSYGVTKGIEATIEGLKGMHGFGQLPGVNIPAMVTEKTFNNANFLIPNIQKSYYELCSNIPSGSPNPLFCNSVKSKASIFYGPTHTIATDSGKLAAKTTTQFSTKFIADEISEVTTASYNSYVAIGYSVLAILIILLVIVIIYLILRYRRKKKTE